MNLLLLDPKNEIGKGKSIYRISERQKDLILSWKKTEGDLIHSGLINHSIGVSKVRFQNEDLLLEYTPKEIPQKSNLINYTFLICIPRPQTGKKLLHLAGSFGVEKLIFGEWFQENAKEYRTSPVYISQHQEYLLEGMEQSKQIYLPNLTFDSKKKLEFQNGFYFDPSGIPITELVDSQKRIASNNLERTNILIGPEKGFSQTDKALLEKLGFQAISIDSKSFRTEVASAIIFYLLENYNSPKSS